MRDDAYQVLGLKRGASGEAIRSAYRSLARQLHPDASGSAETAEAFRRVTEAYQVLRDRGELEAGQPVEVRHGPVAAPHARAEPLRAQPARRRTSAEPLRGPRPRPPRAGTLELPLLWLLAFDLLDD